MDSTKNIINENNWNPKTKRIWKQSNWSMICGMSQYFVILKRNCLNLAKKNTTLTVFYSKRLQLMRWYFSNFECEFRHWLYCTSLTNIDMRCIFCPCEALSLCAFWLLVRGKLHVISKHKYSFRLCAHTTNIPRVIFMFLLFLLCWNINSW